MRKNTKPKSPPVYTHAGGLAAPISPEQELRRSVLNCFLWENQFYEDGEDIAARIRRLAAGINSSDTIAQLAIEARTLGLRHAPLLLLLDLIRRSNETTANTINAVVRRADEIPELISLYWHFNGRKSLPRQMRRGLAMCFNKFDEYQLGKYDSRKSAIKMRDALRLVRPVPKDEKQSDLFKRLKDGHLATPDTWETELSAGKDKKETFERLIAWKKLGYLALLRNLRNMEQAGVDRDLVEKAIKERRGAGMVFPFRFTAAARAAPTYEAALDKALIASIEDDEPLPGRTFVVVDVSGSMGAKLSAKSDMNRMDAAATLASVIPSNDLRVVIFGTEAKEIAARKGMAGVEHIIRSGRAMGGSTYLGKAITLVNKLAKVEDRIIVITDEQSSDAVPRPVAMNSYMINVASYQNGVGYGNGWTHINGFSEAVIRYIREIEKFYG